MGMNSAWRVLPRVGRGGTEETGGEAMLWGQGERPCNGKWGWGRQGLENFMSR